MKPLFDLNDLMTEQLRDLYHGESLLLKHLDTLSTEAMEHELGILLDQYILDTKEQILSLKQVFNSLFTQKRGEKCEAMEVMIKESENLIERSTNAQLIDAAIIISLQHIIHYKIASYGAVCTYAKILGLWDEIAILHRELEREKNVDRKLAMLAESVIDAKVPPYHLN